MTANGILQILILFGLVLACVKPLGLYMARVFARERTFLDPVLAPIERLIYRLSGVRPDASSTGRPTRSRCCSSTSLACCCST